MRELPPDDAPRLVKPRKPAFTFRPIIALTDDEFMLEDESLHPIDIFAELFISLPPSVLIVQDFSQPLQRLQRLYGSDPAFNIRLTPIYRYLSPVDNGRERVKAEAVSTVCNFVGWQTPGKKANQYHYPVDPFHFLQSASSINDLDDSEQSTIRKLLRWGLQLREWCQCNNLQIKASAGGLAAQLLRDSRFYPEPRRKAPRLINDAGRSQLPGNYYRLHAPTGVAHDAIYLDMEKAHHYIAAKTRFPDVNTLHAYGDFSFVAREAKRKPTARPFAPGDSPILKRPGLFHLRLQVPGIPPERFPPPFLERPGEVDRWLYSNELEMLDSFGAEILAVHAAFVSEEAEEGLNRYASWAAKELAHNAACKPWLKPTLHATYGLLAARAVPFETGYLRAKKGERTEYLMGRESFMVQACKRERPIESRIVNVIHRGMIEAGLRKEVLFMAQYLREVHRREILSVYADSLFIRDRGKREPDGDPYVPLLQPPWKISAFLTGLRFHSAVHFTSPSLSRLPGIPRTARENFLRQRELARHIRDLRAKQTAVT